MATQTFITTWQISQESRTRRFMDLVALAIRAGLPVPRRIREEFKDWQAEQWRRQQAALRRLGAAS